MSFSDHKITAFQHKITDLPDQPSLPANELKARFDSSPEQLRVSLNAVCDEAERLDGRVDGIVAGTFGDAIPKSMLSEELQAELDAKATQTALAEEAAAREAETSARESADSALSTRVSSLESAVPQKGELYFGAYIGNGAANQFINLGFTPKAVLVMDRGVRTYHFDGKGDCYGGLALSNRAAQYLDITSVRVETNGFRVYYGWNSQNSLLASSNASGVAYYYMAVK